MITIFEPEILIILETLIIGGVFLFMLVHKDFCIGIYIWLLSVLFFKYERISLAGSFLPDLSIDRVLFLFLIVVFGIELFTHRQAFFSPGSIGWAMFLFCFIAIVSMIWNGLIIKEGGRLSIGQLLTGYIFPFSMFFIAQHIYYDRYKREGFVKFIILLGLYLGVTAILEHYGINRFIWPRYITDPYFGIHFGRARGPFAQAAFNGTVLGFAFVASTYFLFSCGRENILWKILSIMLLVISPIALFFTYTRGTWIGGLLGFIIITWFFLRHRKMLTLLTVGFLAIAIIFTGIFLLDEKAIRMAISRAYSEQPVYDRLNLYIASLNMFKDSPLFGIGFGKFSDRVSDYYINIDGIRFQDEAKSEHDTLVGVLAEMGLIGLALVLYIYYKIISKSIVLHKHLFSVQEEDRFLIYIFWGIWVVFLVNAIFIDMRYSEFINSIVFITAGIIFGWGRSFDEKLIR